MEQLSLLKRKKILTHATKRVNLKTLYEVKYISHKRINTAWFHLNKLPRMENLSGWFHLNKLPRMEIEINQRLETLMISGGLVFV